MKLSKHFSDWELVSPYLLETIHFFKVPVEWYINQASIECLENIRVYFNKPLFVNVNKYMVDKHGFKEEMYKRGICSDQECLDVGRHITSQHCRHGAFDITILDINIDDVVKYIENNTNVKGLGIDVNRNLVHLDFRNSKEIIKWTY